MTLNTRVHIAKPVNAEGLFLHVLDILEGDPLFMPAWERPDDPRDPFKPSPGPLRLTKATYKHALKGEPMRRTDGEVMRHATTGEIFTEDDNAFRSTLGQGLAALLEVEYAADGPLEWPPKYDDDDDDDEDGERDRSGYGDTVEPMPVHLVSINFDTAYGYKLPNGAGCADLHAFLLTEIGLFLLDAGCDEWVWNHEERGSWHGPGDIALRGNAALAAEHFGRSLV